jgi:hypothetical protein
VAVVLVEKPLVVNLVDVLMLVVVVVVLKERIRLLLVLLVEVLFGVVGGVKVIVDVLVICAVAV